MYLFLFVSAKISDICVHLPLAEQHRQASKLPTYPPAKEQTRKHLIYTYIISEREREREREREADRQTDSDRERQRETDRQTETDKQKDTQRELELKNLNTQG